ncbi:calaxin-like [Lycorma delicatula]|uniref:calaxin-like n=1 Tax=Lycorma delicatula TaxID=130591 RepID=UPI003F513BFF
MALMKSVSLFLSSGRRASLARKQREERVEETPQTSANNARTRGRRRRQDNRNQGTGSGRMTEDNKPAGRSTTKVTHVKTSNTKLMESLRRQTHFTRLEVDALCKLYKRLVNSANTVIPVAAPVAPVAGITPVQSSGEGVDRIVFRELLHNTFDVITEEVLMDRIFCAFDKNNFGVIRLEDWIIGLSTFLRGTFEERTSFAFFVYDLNNDGYITREEMFHLLKNSLVKPPQEEDPDEGVRDLVELALRKMDCDRDGKISARDFHEAVSSEPLLMEAFGQCLPTDNSCQTFLSTLL